jgi:hypothetical protein
MATPTDERFPEGLRPAPLLLRPSPLVIKLARILKEINSVPKTGYNSFHQYDYITSDDLMNAIRTKLADAGIFVMTSVESQSIREVVAESSTNPDKAKRSFLTEVSLLHTFIDGESGDSFSVKSQGQGADVADKGGYKAITGAMKYFVYKCFLIATEEGGDELNKTRRLADSGQQPAPDQAVQTKAATVAKPAAAAPGKLNWREVAIHFGTQYKGFKLGDMGKEELTNWFKWAPNPKYRKSAADTLLEAALVEAKKEMGL